MAMNRHDPPAPVLRRVTGKQLCYALNRLGARPAWSAALVAGSQDLRDYWACCAGDLVPEDSPKIGRLAAAAGITVSTLFDLAGTL